MTDARILIAPTDQALIKPVTWLDADRIVRSNIPAGHVLIREMQMVDGNPVCVRERFEPEQDGQR